MRVRVRVSEISGDVVSVVETDDSVDEPVCWKSPLPTLFVLGYIYGKSYIYSDNVKQL